MVYLVKARTVVASEFFRRKNNRDRASASVEGRKQLTLSFTRVSRHLQIVILNYRE